MTDPHTDRQFDAALQNLQAAVFGQEFYSADHPAVVDRLHQSARGLAAALDGRKSVTIVAVGPMPNIREALARAPEIAQRARLIGMYGSVRVGYDGATGPLVPIDRLASLPARGWRPPMRTISIGRPMASAS